MSEKKQFIHLHLHTEYSLLDGASRITHGKKSPLFEACKKKGMPAVAITDHGNMYGTYTFFKEAKKAGIKPIIGCEFYVADNMHERTGRQSDMCHMVLLAKNQTGYKNLVKLDSLAFVEGFYYRPRIDIELLKKHSEGLICLSACLSGKIPKLLLENDYDGAKEYALMLASLFDEGDFYIELQNHGIDSQKRINPLLVKLARELGFKLVATNDVHYLEKEDAKMHDILLCVQTGKTFDDPSRMRMDSEEFYLKDYDEMYGAFSWCPEALETPFEIAAKCDVKIVPHKLMPPYSPDDGSTPQDYLRKETYRRLEKRYKEITPEIRERTEYELSTIIKLGFAEYYLIVWDFIEYARRNGIPVGAGRGSGVGSIVAYAMGITNVDPMRYGLIFERFLNPERVSNPDFDIDFCFEGRGQVKEYVVDKYGKDKVCEIITFNTLKAKGAIKDVARVYNMPFDRVNAITKLVPFMSNASIDEILGLVKSKKGGPTQMVPEIIEMYNNEEDVRQVLDMARKIEGMPRNSGKHAAGVVICKEVISDYVPLQVNGSDVTTQFTKDDVEELGMLKMDFLGLKTLTDVNKAKLYIKQNHGVDIDFDELGYDDPEVYRLIGSGDTEAIFQLESPGMKRFMKDLAPDNMEDIIAGISLYRPGPMDSIPKFVAGKKNPDTISYDHPMLEPILNNTYGCIVYQEQVMEIVRSLGGFTMGRADILRKAMGKKKMDVMLAEKDIFINGCPATEKSPAVDGAVSKGIPKETAEKIFGDMESFASYAFNKSHAAAYAFLAYETAFLKRYYPKEFFCSVINNRITNSDEVAKYVTYLKESGYKVLPPHINKSDADFKVEGDAVRFGLGALKNVGYAAVSDAVRDRQENGVYENLYDAVKRNPSLNKRMLESLIYGGAFDCFGQTRETCIQNYEEMVSQAAAEKKQEATGQMSFFEVFADEFSANKFELKHFDEMDAKKKLIEEKRVLGVYMSGHPLESYREQLKGMDFSLKEIEPLFESDAEDADEEGSVSASEEKEALAREFDGKKVRIGGILSDFRKKPTKTGNTMGLGSFEDLYATIDVVFFPATYERYKNWLEKDAVIILSGILQTEGRLQINVREVEKFSEGKKQETVKKAETTLFVKLSSEAQVDEFFSIVEAYPGSVPAVYYINGKYMRSGRKVNPDSLVETELASLVGAGNVVFKERVV